MDLTEVAARLDADEKLTVTYRFPVSSPDGDVEYQTRHGKVLDVAEEAQRLYVSHDGEVIWITADEVISVAESES